MVDFFAPAKLTRADVRRINLTLHKIGRHLCPDCLGEFERTSDNFTVIEVLPSGREVYRPECKTCTKKLTRERMNRKYQDNAAFAEHRRQYTRDYLRALTPAGKRKRKAQNRINQQRFKAKKRQETAG